MQQSNWQSFFGLLIFIVIVLIAYFLLSSVFHLIRTLDQPLIAAILAAAGAIFASTITVVVGRYFERKKEIEAHFRKPQLDNFDSLLKIMFDLTGSGGKENEDLGKELWEWQRKLILYAGPKTISTFVAWKRELNNPVPRLKSFLLMATLFKSIRSDLGISNRGLSEGDFAYLILKNADLFNALVQKNPEATFNDLIEMEKILTEKPQSLDKTINS